MTSRVGKLAPARAAATIASVISPPQTALWIVAALVLLALVL